MNRPLFRLWVEAVFSAAASADITPAGIHIASAWVYRITAAGFGNGLLGAAVFRTFLRDIGIFCH